MVEKEGIKKEVKAQSLVQTIYLCLVLLLLVGSLFLLSDIKGKLLYHYDGLNDHIFQHLKLKDHYLTKEGESLEVKEENYPQIELNAATQVKNWGIYTMFQLTTSKTLFRDELSSTWKIKSQPNSIYALRTINKGLAVRYKGNVSINGSLMLPEKSFRNDKLTAVTGSVSQLKFNNSYVKAPETLPQLEDKFILPDVDEEFRFRESEISTNKLVNSFQKPTIEIVLDKDKIEGYEILGNVIITSSNIIKIGKSTRLKDCLIIAPQVVVEKGFKGSLQILASQEITIENNVQLENGSALFVKTSNDKGTITIDENSIIDGNIVLIDNDSEEITESFSKLIMSKGVILTGDIYCQGVSFLNGTINGHVYTSSVGSLKGTEESLNVISDVEINVPNQINRTSLRMEKTFDKVKYSVVSKTF